MLPRQHSVELDSDELEEDDDVHARPTGVMTAAAVSTALLGAIEDALASSEASGSIIIDFD